MFKITEQGGPIVNSATVITETTDFIVAELDMKTKYCIVEATCGDMVLIGCQDHSLYWYGDDKYSYTHFELDRPGYEYLACSSGRYSICIVWAREGLMHEQRGHTVWFDGEEPTEGANT